MQKFSNIAALALLAAITANTVNAADKVADQDNNAAAVVNGVVIPQARLEMRLKAAAQQGQQDSPELRKAVKDDLINLEVLAQEALKGKLDQQNEVAQQLALARQSVLAGAFVQNYAKTHAISEELIKKEYDTAISRAGNKEYKVAHILVATEVEAKAVLAALKKKGGKFDKIAKEKSKDPGSKDNGGDLGWTVPSNFVQPFADAIPALAKGQVSDPVQTQFGWHVIKLEDTRDLKVPTYDDVKPNIEKRLQQQLIQEAIKSLRANAKIE
ncbi:MAG: peptidylprolyl isomerase [Gallionellaceae bacterium]|jgi:peptidyl-prolyl cis-trans isomerase C